MSFNWNKERIRVSPKALSNAQRIVGDESLTELSVREMLLASNGSPPRYTYLRNSKQKEHYDYRTLGPVRFVLKKTQLTTPTGPRSFSYQGEVVNILDCEEV